MKPFGLKLHDQELQRVRRLTLSEMGEVAGGYHGEGGEETGCGTVIATPNGPGSSKWDTCDDPGNNG